MQIVPQQPSHQECDRLRPPRRDEEDQEDDDEDDDNDDENDECQTIVAAAGQEVSNGFVKDGRQLPYVFEASDSGELIPILKII